MSAPERPRVLLLHSGFCTGAEWRRTAALLAPHVDVLTPTLPGSLGGRPLDVRRDRSMLTALADDAERQLDEHGWTGPVRIVGSSFGGVTALELAVRGRAASVLALAPPWVQGPRAMAWFGLAFSPQLTMRFQERLYPYTSQRPAVTGLFFGQSLRPAAIDPEDARELWISMGRFPFARVGRVSRGRGPGTPDLAALTRTGATVPTTLVWGSRDPWVHPWMAARWQQVLPTAEVVHLEGFPHQPHLRDPQPIADLVLERSPSAR